MVMGASFTSHTDATKAHSDILHHVLFCRGMFIFTVTYSAQASPTLLALKYICVPLYVMGIQLEQHIFLCLHVPFH